MAKRKGSKNRSLKRFLALILLFITVISGILIYRSVNTRAAVGAQRAQDGANNASQEEGEQEQEEWLLQLVNKQNPIHGDNDIELTELSNGERVDSRIYPQLQKMFDDMRADGVYPIVASGYRTQKEQQQIYDKKMAEYTKKGYSKEKAKKETEKWVAVPGTSEHQLGLGVDINADGVHSYGYEVYNWLAENAHLYGFIHRYPEDKVKITGISNEPWHYRYVGVKAAGEIYKQGVCLEEYLESKGLK